MFEFANNHREVIGELKSHLHTNNIPHYTPRIKRTIKSNLEFGEHIQVLSNYVCGCGQKMDDVDNISRTLNNRILNTHLLRCKNCGHKERVSFNMLRRALSSIDH